MKRESDKIIRMKMTRSVRWLAILIPLLFISMLLTKQGPLPLAKADVPRSVGLTHFDAISLENAVRLEWATETELEALAFIIKRGTADDFTWLQELGSDGYILAKGGPGMGATYEVVDETAVNGQTYTYKLIEVEASLNEVELDAKTVTVGGTPTPTPTPTATAIIIVGQPVNPSPSPDQSQPTNTPAATVTATARPTQTAQSSTTPTGTTTATPTTTATRAATATNSPQTGDTQPPSPSGNSTETVQALAQGEATPEATANLGENLQATGTVAAQPAATAAGNGYPANGTPPASQAEPVQASPAAIDNSTPYPATTATPAAVVSVVPVIGDQNQPDGTNPAATAVSNPPSRSTLIKGRSFLWVGFIAAFIIFIASVFGSIFLFTRKTEQRTGEQSQ